MTDKAWKLVLGDCLEALRAMEADSVDSLVTDPPAGIAFMGKDWDKDKGGRKEWVAWMTDVMRECLRVLKPGAHALVWAIPRTSHWTATALEDAGFEIRDVVTHLFGTGFPKSLDVSKAIDKAAGAERPIIGKIAAPASTRRVQTMGRPDQSGSGWNDAPDLTAPATDEAKYWQGWGTALKPASEHWILCRKPLSEKTVAANVLKWGTGAVNVDGCRIDPIGMDPRVGKGISYGDGERATKFGQIKTNMIAGNPSGRFPANLILSCCGEEPHAEGCAVKALDEQSGTLKSGDLKPGHKQPSSAMFKSQGTIQKTYGGDSGGASRFFYVAKASKSDRGAENKHPTVKSTKLMGYLCRLVTPPNGTVLDPFAGSGSTGVAALVEGFRFVGVERDESYHATAQQRLEEVTGADFPGWSA